MNQPQAGADLGAKIQLARERLDMKQEDLARLVGLGSRQIVSDIERGVRSVKASELVLIARALHTDLTTLLDDPQSETARVLWRSRPTDGAEQVKADFLAWCDRYSRLLRILRLRSLDRLPSYAADLERMRFSDADALAQSTTDNLGLGVRPAAVLSDALANRFGVLVWYLETGAEGSAACSRGEYGSAILLPVRALPGVAISILLMNSFIC